MKEHLQKIASLYADIAKSAKDGDTAALIAKLEEVAPVIEAATAEAGETEQKVQEQAETIEKTQEVISKAVETEIKKYADLYISAADLPKLIEDLLAGSKTFSTVTKSVSDLSEKVETIAKTSAGSKQVEATEEVKKSVSPLAGLAGRL